MNQAADNTTFPNDVYKRTVLEPLFKGAKAYYVEPVSAINRAHLVMLVDTGIVETDAGRAIARALRSIDDEIDLSTLEYTGEYEDYFFLVESELKNRLGVDVAGALHTGRSRNDMDHTIFKMVLRERADTWLTQANQLVATLISKATTERDTLIVAYTHGQPAQPTTFGHYLSAIIEVMLHDITRVQDARDLLNHCPMGAAAITTSGFPINREQVAELLGFSQPKLNSYGCIASVDYITALYSALKLPMLHLGRVVQDLQFWSAFEVGQLYVPNSLVQISSIMPQKRNPVPIEHLRHLASISAGRCDAIVNTMHNTPFTDMNDSEGEVQQAGYAVFESSGRVLELLSAVLALSTVNEDRVAATTQAACITITELADTLVRQESLSFRQAHDIAAVTARDVIERQVPLQEGFDRFAEAFKRSLHRQPSMSKTEFSHVVSARFFVSTRDRPGGPAPAAMDHALSTYAAELSVIQERLEANLYRQRDAETMLAQAFTTLERS